MAVVTAAIAAGISPANVKVRGTYLPAGSGTVNCNAGEAVLGGGVGTDNPSDAYVGRSEPSPNNSTPTGWNGWVRQRSTGNASTGSVYVICATGVTTTVRGTYLPTGVGTVNCNAGEAVLGGGVGTDNPSDAYVGRSEPSPNNGTPSGWTGIVRQRSTGNASTGSAYVICATGVTTTVRGTYLPTGAGTVPCNAGEAIVGGGVGTDNPADAYVGRSEPSPNNGTPTGWTGIVRQRSTGNASTGSVFVICAAPPPPATTPTVTPTTTPTGTVTPTTTPTGTVTPTTTAAASPSPTPPAGAVPPGSPNPQPSQTQSAGGAEITLATRATCVSPGETLRATISVDKGRGARFRRITRVDFLLDGVRIRRDRRAPFSVRVFIKRSQRGKTYTLRARVHIRLRGGAKLTRSVTVRYRVCSS